MPLLILDRIAGRSPSGLPTRVGGRVPAHATALGKAMLAQMAAEEVDAIYTAGISKRTPRTIADVPTLHQELSRVRGRHGLAFENQELVLGASALGAAVHDGDGLFGAISLGGMLPLEKLERLGPLLLRAAAYITQRLAGPTRPVEAVRPTTDGILGRMLQTLPADGWV